MSSRTIFTERNSLPGLVFLLTVLLIFAREIIYVISVYPNLLSEIGTIGGIALTFASVFGSSVLGFIISQFWYFFWTICYEILFFRIGAHFRIFPFNILIDEFHIDDSPRNLITTFHYLSSRISEVGIRGYLDRRQDIFNLHGSSIISTIFGLLIGFRLKHYFIEFYIRSQNTTFSLLHNSSYLYKTTYEHYLTIFLFLYMAVLLVSLLRVLNHHFHMIIRVSRMQRPNLDIFFPPIVGHNDAWIIISVSLFLGWVLGIFLQWLSNIQIS